MILEKAIKNGLKPVTYQNLPPAGVLQPADFDNLRAVTKTLDDLIAKDGAVIPQKSTGAGSSDLRKVFFAYIHYLAANSEEYGLKALKVNEALANEFNVNINEITVRKAGVQANIFYKDEKQLSQYLRNNFSGPKTTHTFELK